MISFFAKTTKSLGFGHVRNDGRVVIGAVVHAGEFTGEHPFEPDAFHSRHGQAAASSATSAADRHYGPDCCSS